MTSLEPANYITDQSFLYYDAETMPFKNKFISHFALSDALMASAGRHQQPMIHFWPTSNLVILGMMDTKLPYFSEALAVLKAAGKNTIVRNSGGLAVVGDEGVLNFSIILPERERIPIDVGYAIMLLLVDRALKQYGKTIEAYEIEDSYCPGDFDLSIDGKKFAGIAQRRLKNGIAIMIYISVTGNQQERAELIREFYQAGLNNETVKWHYPKINPSVMATLEDLLEVHMTVDELKELILNSLRDLGASLSKGTYTEEIIEDYQSAFQKMIRRNEQMLGDHLDRRLLDEPNV
ncbi:MAG: lipoate--protein ligase family protein [Desemzia incerta]|uniref:lipoate--protein ligase family protein n=1 Tax=Desemzia incerta TaxID=82801 RepID=UPI0033151BC6